MTTIESPARTKHVDLLVPVDMAAHECDHKTRCPGADDDDRTAAAILQWDPASQTSLLCNGVRVDSEGVAWVTDSDGAVTFYPVPVYRMPVKPEGFEKLHNPELIERLAEVPTLEWAGRYAEVDDLLNAVRADGFGAGGVRPETTAPCHAPVSIGYLRAARMCDQRGRNDKALAALDKGRRINLADYDTTASAA